MAARKRLKKPALESVYFIESPTLGLVKIGSARDPKRRLAALQTGSADKLVLAGVWLTDDAKRLEADFHFRCYRAREHGEWFRKTEEVEGLMTLAQSPGGSGMVVHRFAPEADRKLRLRILREEDEGLDQFIWRVEKECRRRRLPA